MRKIIWAFLLAVPTFSQVSNPSIIVVNSAPTGPCTAGLPNQQVATTGVQYSCQNGTWGAINGGSGGSGTVNSGTTGQIAYYGANGTAVSGNADLVDSSGNITNVPSLNGAYFLINQNPAIANLMWGNDAAYSNLTTGAAGDLAIGLHALHSLTTGGGDTAIGWDSQFANQTGNSNTSLGEDALKYVTGSENIGIGYTAGYSLTSGGQNVAVGNSALYNNVSSSANTAVGYWALYSDTATQNVGVGYYALKANTTGSNNISIGYDAGYTSVPANANVSGSQNIWIGSYTGPAQPAQVTNSIAIGYNVQNSASNQAILGNSSVGQTILRGVIINAIGLPVASSATIAPVAAITHITGTATISTITVPVTGFTGCIRLIPDGLWSTTTGGNIALASTAVASKVLEECYDGTSWYPSY